MTSLTYTANNRDGQTWLVCPSMSDILLTDHLPDGTKVRGDEIEIQRRLLNRFSGKTIKVATLKKMRFEAVGIDDEIPSICDWLLEKYNHDFTAENGRFYKISRLSIAELIIEYHKSRVKSREK